MWEVKFTTNSKHGAGSVIGVFTTWIAASSEAEAFLSHPHNDTNKREVTICRV